MERRNFLESLTALSLGVVLDPPLAESAPTQAAPPTTNSSAATSKSNEFPSNSTIVMVHGAWADGSCWRNIVVPLERQGLRVMCAPIPMTTLSDDIAALSHALERTNGPVVLVGHAYSGGVIAGIKDDRVKSLVYIAALAPDEGETVGKVFYRDQASPEQPKLAPDAHGFIWIPDGGFRRAVAHKASPEQLAIAQAAQRPIGVQCIQEAAPAPAWKTKPSWYLIAEEDRMINPKTQHFMADRMNAHKQSHQVDHSPMYSAPNLVAAMISEAATQTLSK